MWEIVIGQSFRPSHCSSWPRRLVNSSQTMPPTEKSLQRSSSMPALLLWLFRAAGSFSLSYVPPLCPRRKRIGYGIHWSFQNRKTFLLATSEMTVDIFQPEGHFNDNKVLCAAPSRVVGYLQSNQHILCVAQHRRVKPSRQSLDKPNQHV